MYTEVTEDTHAGMYSLAASRIEARNAVSASILSAGRCGMGNTSTSRTLLSFTLPDLNSVLGASLFVKGSVGGNQALSGFRLFVVEGEFGVPIMEDGFIEIDGYVANSPYIGTILNEEYNDTDYSEVWNEIVFNSTGLLSIYAHKNTTYKLALLSKNDYDMTDPGALSRFVFADYASYLAITYANPPEYTQTVGGSLTPMGVLWRDVYITLGGSLTPTGSLKTDPCSVHVGGSLTFSGLLNRKTSISVGGDLGFVGSLGGRNPNWLLIPDFYTWQGVWAAGTYNLGDAVLYMEGDRYFAYAAKDDCTAADVPGVSKKWYRIQQNPWRKT